MNCFLFTLLLILAVGIAITQLAFVHWTDGYLWNGLHAILLLLSILACWLILKKAVRWAVFPYNSSLIAVAHHLDLNMRLTQEMVRLFKGVTRTITDQM